MRTIDRSSKFRRDFKRTVRTYGDAQVNAVLTPIIAALAGDMPLHPRHQDHALKGAWVGYRECHVRPDLLLIYRKPDAVLLELAGLGSHAHLFGR